MPRKDGFAVLEFLKGNPEWAVRGASSYHVKPRTHGALVHQMLVLHAYWMTCEVPEVDSSGRQLRTESGGKLGERFPQPGDNSTNSKSRLRRKTGASGKSA